MNGEFSWVRVAMASLCVFNTGRLPELKMKYPHLAAAVINDPRITDDRMNYAKS